MDSQQHHKANRPQDSQLDRQKQVGLPPVYKLLVFTDLDGTLLDHDNYRFDAAIDALSTLHDLQIPVIPTTSKTRAELEHITFELKRKAYPAMLEMPVIVENGAAIYFPNAGYFADLSRFSQTLEAEYSTQPLDTEGDVTEEGISQGDSSEENSTEGDSTEEDSSRDLTVSYSSVKAFGSSREQIQRYIDEKLGNFSACFKTFSQLGTHDIARHTGLSEDAADLANQRDYSEPMLWLGDDEEKAAVRAQVEADGLNFIEGGRFVHITKNYDKAIALAWLQGLCKKYENQSLAVKSLALGDGGNDIAMIKQADLGVIIKNHKGQHVSLNESVSQSPDDAPTERHTQTTPYKIYKTAARGPQGWAEAIFKLDLSAQSPHFSEFKSQ